VCFSLIAVDIEDRRNVECRYKMVLTKHSKFLLRMRGAYQPLTFLMSNSHMPKCVVIYFVMLEAEQAMGH